MHMPAVSKLSVMTLFSPNRFRIQPKIVACTTAVSEIAREVQQLQERMQQRIQSMAWESRHRVQVEQRLAQCRVASNMADRVYIEPITLYFVTEIIRPERPDGLLPTLGGQTGLNMAVELARAGILEQENVKMRSCRISVPSLMT